MGRYYSGDIEGNFLFGVQPSDDARFFGGVEQEPNFITYYFDKDDLSDIEKGIATCKKELGKCKTMIDDFFKEHNSYNDDIIAKALQITKSETETLLGWHARLELGQKILKCVEKQGECTFDAEL